MVRVYVSTVLDAPPDAVWARLRDFNGLPQWTPFVAESRIEEGLPADRIGCVRNFRLRDGGVIRERQPGMVDLAGWQAIDREEKRRGAAAGRPRIKIVDVDEMRRVAARAAEPRYTSLRRWVGV